MVCGCILTPTQISAEAYVQSQSDTQERTKKLVAEFVKVSSTYKNKTKNDAFDDPYVVVLLDGNAINVSPFYAHRRAVFANVDSSRMTSSERTTTADWKRRSVYSAPLSY